MCCAVFCLALIFSHASLISFPGLYDLPPPFLSSGSTLVTNELAVDTFFRYSADDISQKAKSKAPRTTASSGTASPSGAMTPPHPALVTGRLKTQPSISDLHATVGAPLTSVATNSTKLSTIGSKSTITAPEYARTNKRASMHLGPLPIPGWATPGWSTPGTEEGTPFSEWGHGMNDEKKRKRRREKKKRQEVYVRVESRYMRWYILTVCGRLRCTWQRFYSGKSLSSNLPEH